MTARDALAQAAATHLALGHSLLPVNAEKRPHSAALIATGHARTDPHPTTGAPRVTGTWKPLQQTRPTRDMTDTWLRHGTGLALITGQISGIIVIDVDVGGGTALFDRWGLTARAHVRSPSGGLHWYLRHPGWPVQTLQSQTVQALDAIKGIDIRADGGYVVIPPTTFRGRTYEQLRPPHELDDAALLPPDIQALLGLDAPRSPRPPRPSAPPAPSAVPPRPPGRGAPRALPDIILERALDRVHGGAHRNDTSLWLAAQLRDNGLSAADAHAVMLRYVAGVPATNLKGEADPFTAQEMEGTLRSAYAAPARSAWQKRPPPTPAARLEQVWPHLNDQERAALAEAACGVRSDARADLITTLRRIAPNVTRAAEAQDAKTAAAGLVRPGLNALLRLLTRHERR